MSPEIYIPMICIASLLGLSAFFSGSETALTAASRARMRSQEDQGDLAAGRVSRLTSNRERLIGAILLGNNLVNILATALTTSLFLQLFPGGGEIYATIVMTILVLIFSEVAPKTAAISNPEGFAKTVSAPMAVVVTLFAPITAVVQWIVRGALRVIGVDVENNAEVLSVAEELKGAIELHHEEGRVHKDARDLIRGALELEDIKLEEIMLHRKSMEMLDIDLPAEQIISAVMDSPHTRIPLWKDDPDNIVGVLHAKDLLRAIWAARTDVSKINIANLAMEPYFVPETTTLQEQLDAFRENQQHFALIVDEYGALMGLVTMEDILEEIVGEIEDEYDEPLQGVRPQGDGSIFADGDVTIRDLNRAMDWRLPDIAAVTIAGLVIHEAQTIPDINQVFSFHGYRFQIVKKRRNQITALRITPLSQDTE